MGNTVVKIIRENENIPMDEVVNIYMKTVDLKRKWANIDIDKCNKHIELISNIIRQHFQKDVLFVSSRMKLKDKTEIGIATFYIKWIHLMASIQLTQMKEDDNITQFCGSRLFELFYDKQLPDLDTLYNDAEYHDVLCEFKGRSKEMNQAYNADLSVFYRTFTGKDTMDPDIRQFTDILIKTHCNSVDHKTNTMP